MVVVREGTEGPYAGAGGFLRRGTPHEVATEESLNTRYGVERVVRDAFGRAPARPRRLLTLVHKNNVLTHAGDLWTRTFAEVAPDFPDVADRLPARRRRVDVLRHAAAAVRRRRHRQPVRRHPHRPRRGDRRRHRAGRQRQPRRQPGQPAACSSRCTARRPDIAGQGKADPTATVLSVAMLLDHLGLPEAGGAGWTPRSPRTWPTAPRVGPRTTAQVGDALAARAAG